MDMRYKLKNQFILGHLCLSAKGKNDPINMIWMISFEKILWNKYQKDYLNNGKRITNL